MTSTKPRVRATLRALRAALFNPKALIVTGAVIAVVAIVALIVDQGPQTSADKAAVPLERTMTQVVDDAKLGRLASVRVDETRLVMRVQYAHAPTDGTPTSPAPKAGDIVEVPVLTATIPQMVASLVAADVPVSAATGSLTYKDRQTGATTTVKPAHAEAADTRRRWYVSSLFFAGVFMAVGALWQAQRRTMAAAEGAFDSGPAVPQNNTKAAAASGRGSDEVEPATVPDTRFTDVAGCNEAIEELSELVLFLREPERFTRTGAKAPKGALLTGPPGTGKTLLARAVAGESGVPLFAVAGSDFVEMYVGVGAKRVRALFAAARKHEKAIIFIDEIDAVARRRSPGGDAGHAEHESTLIALLAEMDGFDASNVVVIAATNRADMLDEAIKRPGRLDRKVEVPNPDRRGRQEILGVHARNKPLAADVDLEYVARRTPGFSGAQLAALVNEACMNAARADVEQVTAEHFDFAVATIAMGRARTSALVTDFDREVTAWHEAGHTLAAYLQPDADDPVQVTIVPRGPAGGVTWMSGNDDIFLSRRKAHAQLVTALAGRAAEEALMGGEFTQGASGDLQSATQTAMAMVTQYGMTRLGYQVRGEAAAGDAKVQEVVEELLSDAHVKATALLAEHREFLAAVAAQLLEDETLTLAQVAQIGDRLGVPRHANVPVADLPEQVRAQRTPPAPVPLSSTRPGPALGAPVPPRARRTRSRTPLAAAMTRVRSRRRAQPAQPPTAGAA